MSEARKDFSDDRTFLIDLTRCTGCRGCQVACKQWNQLEAEKTTILFPDKVTRTRRRCRSIPLP